jgi:NADH-quinone oxidoreductase subunit G
VAVLALARAKAVVNDTWNGFNFLHTAANRMGALMLGFTPPQGQFSFNGIKAVWLQGVDTFVVNALPQDAFVIYQGHHGDVGAARADVIFPGCTYTEKNATYVNTEGRVQQTRQATSPVGDAKEDWKIIRAFSEVLGKPLAFNTLSDLRAAMVRDVPALDAVDAITPVEWSDFGHEGVTDAAPFGLAIANYYQTCPISRASVVMAECTDAFVRPVQTKQ